MGGLAAGVVRVGRAAILAALAGLAAGTLAPAAFGWHPTIVVSDSMVPAVHAGDVVVTAPLSAADAARLPLGSVVLAADPARPGGLLLHRVVGRRPDGTLVTKGDANALPDSTPLPPGNLRGMARLRIPAVGVPVLRARTGDPVPAGALVVLTVVLVAAPVRRRGRHAR
jgi:signal peptidase I